MASKEPFDPFKPYNEAKDSEELNDLLTLLYFREVNHQVFFSRQINADTKDLFFYIPNHFHDFFFRNWRKRKNSPKNPKPRLTNLNFLQITNTLKKHRIMPPVYLRLTRQHQHRHRPMLHQRRPTHPQHPRCP